MEVMVVAHRGLFWQAAGMWGPVAVPLSNQTQDVATDVALDRGQQTQAVV